jgi:ferritin-like metal-binding protein YciE
LTGVRRPVWPDRGRVGEGDESERGGDMFDKVEIETPKQLFTFKLGAALTMENTVLDMLGELQEKAQSPELKQQFSHHADETRRQIANLEQAFTAIGEEPDKKPCPAIEGIEKEGQANIKMTDDSLVDGVILAGAAETEHHEIAVYEGLITHAEAMGEQDVVALLQENLEQEQHTLQEVKQATQSLAQQMATSRV